MGFDEIRFPVDIAYGSSGGPEYATDIIVTGGGYEQRNCHWEAARARYNVAHGVKTQAQLDMLIAFFRARKGRARGFRFKDWADYKAEMQLLGQGDGIREVFQLVKHYISGDGAETRRITKPVSGSVQIYKDGVMQENGYSVASDTGTVAFDVPPEAGTVIEADFEFDVPVRFDTDQLSARLDNYGLFSWTNIPLIELRG
jgi:uncharacterized protein (TIGR02217 family)